MAELKPCPFCGGKAFLAEWTYDLTPGNVLMHFVECNGCHAITFEYDTEEEAIEAWNRRTDEELKFTREFIHEHGLEFELASAWNRRAEDGK